MVELPLVLTITWLLYQLLFYKKYAVLTAIALGIAAGFRQDVLMFLGPFWLAGTIRVGARTMILSWLALVVSVTLWMAPLIYFADGISKYREMNSLQFQTGVFLTSIFSSGPDGGIAGFFRNAKEVWRAMLWLMGFASILYIFIGGLFLMPGRLASDRRYLFLVLLSLPSFGFFVLFHFGQPGYLLVYCAPLVIVFARALILISKDINQLFSGKLSDGADRTSPEDKRRSPGYVFLIAFISLTVFFNAYLFIEAARIEQQFPTSDGKISELYGNYSATGIREGERQLEAALSKINEYDPANTIVNSVYVAPSPYPYAPDWRRLMYYLPEYRVLMLQINSGDGYSIAQNHYFSTVAGSNIPVDENITKAIFIGVKPSPATVELVAVQEIPSYALINEAAIPSEGSTRIGPFNLTR